MHTARTRSYNRSHYVVGAHTRWLDTGGEVEYHNVCSGCSITDSQVIDEVSNIGGRS